MIKNSEKASNRRWFIIKSLSALAGISTSYCLWETHFELGNKSQTFIGKAENYNIDIKNIILSGMKELGISSKVISGKKILLKPNLVEPHADKQHINTHPLVIRGAVEAFLSLGARQVVVAEGPGHRRDIYMVLDESGLEEVLVEDKIPFVDLNNDDIYPVSNLGNKMKLKAFYLPKALEEADWIVSMPKMKTHHWAGVTLSMKNMFGVMPGRVYGWPKNVLHYNGINESILDIVHTVKPHFAIVDGITGMDGDGPIMGNAKHAGVIVMGRNLPSVDATCARIMKILPERVPSIKMSSGYLGPILEHNIKQVGEKLSDVATEFKLLEKIAAQKYLRDI